MEPRLPLSLDDFRSNLQRLIAKFQADQAHYLSKAYPEAQARIDFITPFFKALGWDVENEAGLAHQEREVIVERGGEETQGRPDYSFRLRAQVFPLRSGPFPCHHVTPRMRAFTRGSFREQTLAQTTATGFSEL